MNVKNAQENSKNKPIIIPDSSTIIDLVAKKKIDEKACTKLLHDITHGDIHIAMLPLLYWEVGNWVGRTYPKMATELLSSIMLWDTVEHPLDIYIVARTIEITSKYRGVTFYDASFHALAIILNGTLITSDKAYYNATHKLGHIRLLKDY